MPKDIDLTGQRFGKLTVICEHHRTEKRGKHWLCRCDCGNECVIPSWNLRGGSTINCGCTNRRNEKYDFTGRRFGRLLVVRRAEDSTTKGGRKIKRWHCLCDCGKEKDIDAWHLASGRIRSCGCYFKDISTEMNKTHGMTNTSFYHTWAGMNARCKNKNNPDYGGRGIEVCERWKGKNGFENFYADMYETYKEGLSIDRIDVNGNYEPSNCRWATSLQQSNNRRITAYIEIDGETHTITEWCRILNINYGTVKSRIKRSNMNPKDALLMPLRGKKE